VGHLRLSLVALASVKSAALVLELNLTVREARAPARSANAEAIGRMVEDEEPEFRAAVISDADSIGSLPILERIRSRKPKFDWSRKASTTL
jgi:hypothetical protein